MLYRNVAVQIRTEFGDGRFSPGTLLPSENDFVEAFAVSRTTVHTLRIPQFFVTFNVTSQTHVLLLF